MSDEINNPFANFNGTDIELTGYDHLLALLPLQRE